MLDSTQNKGMNFKVEKTKFSDIALMKHRIEEMNRFLIKKNNQTK